MASTINDQGFTKQRYQDLRLEIAQDFAADGLPDVSNNLQSVPGRIVSQVANLQERNDAFAQAILQAFNPYGATGDQLSRLAPLMGKKRRKPTKSFVMLDVTADANGCTIPAGSQVGDGVSRVATVNAVTLAPNQTLSIGAEAVDYGEILFSANTLTRIETPVYGWKSANNANASTVGTVREEDTQLRYRALKSPSRKTSSTFGIFTALSELDGVTYAFVDDNKTDVTNAKGLLPHSVFPIVEGGSDDDVADVLMRYVSAGIDTNPSIPGATITTKSPINPANRQPMAAHFARPTKVAIKVGIEIQADPKLPPDYEKQIKDQLIAYIKSRDVGAKLIASRLYSPINNVEGFEINDVKLAKVSGSLTNEIVLLSFERATLDAANIAITVVP